MIILDEMESKGMTQKEFAEKAGCSQQYISRILKGRENLSLETISKIESALGTSIVEIKVYQSNASRHDLPTTTGGEVGSNGFST